MNFVARWGGAFPINSALRRKGVKHEAAPG